MINYQTVKIFWNSGEMEIAASAIAFAPLANLRKLIFPHLAGCSPEDKKKIIDCIVADYSAAVEREKVSNAKALFARLSEFCTVCGVNLPANLPKIKTGNNPDYNYKINYKKLAIVGSIPAPGEDFERCTVPITRRNDTSGLTECYAGPGRTPCATATQSVPTTRPTPAAGSSTPPPRPSPASSRSSR